MTAATTSEHGGYIRGIVAASSAATYPLDTAMVRDGLINNLAHLCDSDGQVLINVTRVTAAWEYPVEAPTAFFGRMSTVPAFEVPTRVRHDGASQHIVVQLRCSISSAGTAHFRVVFRARNAAVHALPPDPALGATWVADVSTTSTTGADLDPSPLYWSAGQVATRWLGSITSHLDLPSTDGYADAAVGEVMVGTLEIWAKSSVKTALPRVHSIMAREYIGKLP